MSMPKSPVKKKVGAQAGKESAKVSLHGSPE
jgi:hypothetical protein